MAIAVDDIVIIGIGASGLAEHSSFQPRTQPSHLHTSRGPYIHPYVPIFSRRPQRPKTAQRTPSGLARGNLGNKSCRHSTCETIEPEPTSKPLNGSARPLRRYRYAPAAESASRRPPPISPDPEPGGCCMLVASGCCAASPLVSLLRKTD